MCYAGSVARGISLSEKFAKKWETMRDEQPFTNRKKDTDKSLDPLKPRLDFAISRIELLTRKLDRAEDRFDQREKAIFTKLVEAYTKHNTVCACVLAYDRVEVRKISILIINSKSALEQISFRLRTASKLDDIVSSLGPALAALRTVKSRLVTVFPETENELGEIGNMLSGIMTEAGQSSGMALNFDAVDEDADKILSEAATIAKQRIEAKFPSMQPGHS